MQQAVVINDAALGQWALQVSSVCKNGDGTYAFEDYGTATDLVDGHVCIDEQFLHMLADYALDEGYTEQNISAQCAVLYDSYFATA